VSVAQIELFYLAHSRTGDKGDSQTLSVIAYDPADYPLLCRVVTASAVARHFAGAVHGPVTRYELPRLFALHFVLERALAGGVNDSLALDTHGKSRSSLLLAMPVEVPDGHAALCRAALGLPGQASSS
jgi:hypothetical protein